MREKMQARSIVFLVVLLIGLSQAWENSIAVGPRNIVGGPVIYPEEDRLEPCGPCDRSKCVEPRECKAGIVSDRCDCCSVCGLEESHLCNLPEEIPPLRRGSSAYNWHGRCGINLECRKRTDVDQSLVGPQSICYCVYPGLVCGTDGKMYSHCQLEAELAFSRGMLSKSNDGPCITKPQVEMNGRGGLYRKGDNITLICEARGYPNAEISWYHSKPGDGSKSRRMPGDSEDITVSVRGGNTVAHVTSYLQITNFKLDFEGTYRCLAENEMGTSSANTSLVIEL